MGQNKTILLKAISWRIIASIIAFSIIFLITGSVVLGGTISLIDIFVKIVAFYFHEKAWLIIEKKRSKHE